MPGWNGFDFEFFFFFFRIEIGFKRHITDPAPAYEEVITLPSAPTHPAEEDIACPHASTKHEQSETLTGATSLNTNDSESSQSNDEWLVLPEGM